MVLAKTGKFRCSLGSTFDMYDNGVQSRIQKAGKTMTGETGRDPRNGDDERMEALLRADAAAIIDDDIDDDANGGAETVDTATHPSRRPRSQVYSIRVPVERLEQVRSLAKERAIAPTAMLRDWVLQQLDIETGQTSTQSHLPKQSVPDSSGADARLEAASAQLEAATQAMLSVVMQLAAALTKSVDLLAVSRPTEPARRNRSSAMARQAASLPVPYAALAASYLPPTVWPTSDAFCLFPEPPLSVTWDPVSRGVAALRATVENSATWSGSGHDVADLDSLYIAADEELSKP